MSPTDLAIVLASAFLHAIWSVAIKQSGDPLCFNWLQSWIAALALAAMTPWIPWSAIPREIWVLLALTAPAHALYLYWMSRAFQLGELSLVYPIARSTPAFLPLFAMPLFGESLRPFGVLGIAIVVGGIWLVHIGPASRPRGEADPSGVRVGLRFAYLTLFATVAYSLIDKAAMATFAASDWPTPLPRSLVYALLLFIGHAAAFTPLVLAARGRAALRDVVRMDLGRAVAAAGISVIGYVLILRAFETAPASYVVAVRQTSVLFVVALGALWLRERPGRPRVIGATATVVGVALIARFG